MMTSYVCMYADVLLHVANGVALCVCKDSGRSPHCCPWTIQHHVGVVDVSKHSNAEVQVTPAAVDVDVSGMDDFHRRRMLGFIHEYVRS